MWKPGRAALGAVFTCLAAPSAIAYHTYDQLHTELLALQTAHPTRAQLISIGHGWELVGRDQRQIWALKITEDVGKDSNKPEIVFVGGHHAREWVSVEIPLGIAQHSAEQRRKGPFDRRACYQQGRVGHPDAQPGWPRIYCDKPMLAQEQAQ